jgi:hypothetical protein
MGSLTPSAVKTFREKGARFIHALTCEEDMGKRKVKNSLPPAALEKKAQSKRTLLNTAKDRPERRSFLYGRSEVIRTPGILLPNLSRILFPFVYSGFRRFLICFTCSLTLLSPLFPGVPAPYVVIYVVKNASRPVSGEDSPVPGGKRFVFQTVCIVTLRRVLCKWFLSRGQFKG